MSLVGDELALECKKLLRLERALYSGRTMMSFSFCRRSVSRRPLFVDRKRDVLLCRLPRWSRCRFIVHLESIIVKQMRMYQRYWELEVCNKKMCGLDRNPSVNVLLVRIS